MKKQITFMLAILISWVGFAQMNHKITSVDFVQVLEQNLAECRYYYQNNWKALRAMALDKNYIDSFQLLEAEATPDAPFSFILMTTFTDKKQFDEREEHFQELIKIHGGLNLLNDKKPKEFRKTLFGKDAKVLE